MLAMLSPAQRRVPPAALCELEAICPIGGPAAVLPFWAGRQVRTLCYACSRAPSPSALAKNFGNMGSFYLLNDLGLSNLSDSKLLAVFYMYSLTRLKAGSRQHKAEP